MQLPGARILIMQAAQKQLTLLACSTPNDDACCCLSPRPLPDPLPDLSCPHPSPTGRCRPSKRDNCTCTPDAALLGGGSFLAMPQWRRSTLPGPRADTMFQVGGRTRLR